MIVCKRKHLLLRCLERGYSVESVQPCIVSEDGDTITVDETHPAYPRLRPGQAAPRPRPPKPDPALIRDPDASPLTWVQKAKNFAAATAKHVAAGAPTCTDEEIVRRHDICMACEFLVDGACAKCGCPIKREKAFISKLAWADQGCPIGKWGPVDGK